MRSARRRPGRSTATSGASTSPIKTFFLRSSRFCTTITLGVLCLLTLLLTTIPGTARVRQSVPSDTRSLIERRGFPDYRVPVQPGEDDYLLLYDAGDTPDGDIDFAYLVNAEEGIEEKILVLEERSPRKPDKPQSRKNWFRETVEDLRETVDALKETRDSLNRSVHALPGFNQFDGVEVIDNEMTFRIGTEEDTVSTTLVYEPRKDWVSLTFRVPFGN